MTLFNGYLYPLTMFTTLLSFSVLFITSERGKIKTEKLE